MSSAGSKSVRFEFPEEDLLCRALHTEHAGLALTNAGACKYPRAVAPFAALDEPSERCLAALRELMVVGEKTHVFEAGALPSVPGLEIGDRVPVVRMAFPGCLTSATAASSRIEALDSSHAGEMVALTDVAFPGFFQSETWRMGSYYGIRHEGQLIAMAGERVIVPGWREISGVCTHPAHVGHGYAASLIEHLLKEHAARGWQSYLHVSPENTRARELYERLGFALLSVRDLRPVWRKK